MAELKCIYCDSDLVVLPNDHKEFRSASLTYDGTRKWFLCKSCTGVFIYDKLTRSWKLSPSTYTRFVEEGKIPDKLS